MSCLQLHSFCDGRGVLLAFVVEVTSLELVRVYTLEEGWYGMSQVCQKVNLALLPNQSTCCGRLACYIYCLHPLLSCMVTKLVYCFP